MQEGLHVERGEKERLKTGKRRRGREKRDLKTLKK